jgi:hypothetical protein
MMLLQEYNDYRRALPKRPPFDRTPIIIYPGTLLGAKKSSSFKIRV